MLPCLIFVATIVALQVSLPHQPRVGSVLVSLAQGQQQNFAVFLVNLREGNTAEYKPCDTYSGVSGEEMVEIDCDGERVGFGVGWVCETGFLSGQQGQFVFIRDDRSSEEYFGVCEVQVLRFKGIELAKKCLRQT